MDNLKNLDNILVTAKRLVWQLVKNENCVTKDIPKTQGVYLIYNKGGGIIYVGKAKNLHRRINSDHISGEEKITTSTFRGQLMKKQGLAAGKGLRQWVIDNCLFSYIEIPDSDMCDMVESLTILTLRSGGSKLLNHLVQ